MKLEKQFLEDHQVRISVEVDSEPLDNAKRRAARQIAKQTRIPGFRPGKAPYAVVVRHVGEATVMDEAIEILVNDIYPEIIDEAKIEPYGPGTLEDIPSLDPLKFEFMVPLQAEVELGDYLSVRLPYELKDITDEDVDRVITNLRERQAVIEPIDRPAQESDLVSIALNASREEPSEGQNPTLIENRTLSVVIEAEDQDTRDEWPFPGFSRKLIGHSTGDEINFTYSFPEDATYEALRGIGAEFHIQVNDVRLRTLPDLNDDFAKSVGDYETLEDLRTEIGKELEEQEKNRYNTEYDNQVLEQIVATSTIKYPPQMLEREIDNVISRLERDLNQQNLDMELYLKTRQMEMDELREEVKPIAETRLKKSLTLIELSEAENIQVDQEVLQSETNRTLQEMSQYVSEGDFRKLISDENARVDLIGNIMMDMLAVQSYERIRNIARGLAESEAESTQKEITGAKEEADLPKQAAAKTGEIDLEDEQALPQAEQEAVSESEAEHETEEASSPVEVSEQVEVEE